MSKYDKYLNRIREKEQGRSNDNKIEQISVFIELPEEKDYKIITNIPFGGTINSVTVDLISGMGEIITKINGVALGGPSNFMMFPMRDVQTHSSDNVFSIGDDISVGFSGVSTMIDVSINIEYTKG